MIRIQDLVSLVQGTDAENLSELTGMEIVVHSAHMTMTQENGEKTDIWMHDIGTENARVEVNDSIFDFEEIVEEIGLL